MFSSLAHLLIGLFAFLVLSFLSSLYIQEINALSEVHVVKIFSQSVDVSNGHLCQSLPYLTISII